MSRNANANRKPHWSDLKDAGDFIFTGATGVDGHAGMIFMCPCGCGDRSPIRFRQDANDSERPCWNWDGNESSPTLTPSLHKTSGCGWHGYLTAGVFKEC